ncbi:MAG: hypothetical protein HGA45_23580 [Chloroflexales bacterium]|nr:hypothetical protein [Chloroflexales bacterium]
MMIYPSYMLANLIADGAPIGTRGGALRVLWLAALSAMIMTAWDVVLDPMYSTVMHGVDLGAGRRVLRRAAAELPGLAADDLHDQSDLPLLRMPHPTALRIFTRPARSPTSATTRTSRSMWSTPLPAKATA